MGDGLRRNAYKYPVKIAAKDRFREVTYSELNSRVNQLAHGLLSMGVRKGDSVAVMVGNRIEHLEILFATAKIGALAIPLDIKWKALELGSVVSFFNPSLLILQQECVEEFDAAKSTYGLSFLKPVVISDLSYGGVLNGRSSAEPSVQVSEDDPFAVLLTSGTTVTWAHHALLHNDRRGLVLGLTCTIVLGILFTTCQAYEYVHAGFGFANHIYGSTFFMATGFHGFHVIVGTIFLTVCLIRAMRGDFTPKQHFGFEAAAWYWHFVDVVWLFLFTCIYVWGGGSNYAH